jgi:predicted metal-dependent HD superfamily phosphohydrolase
MASESLVESLIQQGLIEIDQKYGKNGSRPRIYYGVEHTIDVINDFTSIGRLALERGKITVEELQLGKLAASHHDNDKDASHGEAERNSAGIIAKRMAKTGAFAIEAIDRVWRMIDCTKVEHEGNKVLQFPGSDYLCKALCDADLAALGKPFETFKEVSTRFYRDINDNPEAVPGREFWIAEIELLESHTYFTSEANELFPYQAENAEQLKKLISKP